MSCQTTQAPKLALLFVPSSQVGPGACLLFKAFIHWASVCLPSLGTQRLPHEAQVGGPHAGRVARLERPPVHVASFQPWLPWVPPSKEQVLG